MAFNRRLIRLDRLLVDLLLSDLTINCLTHLKKKNVENGKAAVFSVKYHN